VKENRTYDQVLGDLDRGNGDPSLAEFGRVITPNQHVSLAKIAIWLEISQMKVHRILARHNCQVRS
jgi:hypothetical protein